MFLSQTPSKINKNMLSVRLLRRFLRSKISYPQQQQASNIPKERPEKVPKDAPKEPKEMPKEVPTAVPKAPKEMRQVPKDVPTFLRRQRRCQRSFQRSFLRSFLRSLRRRLRRFPQEDPIKVFVFLIVTSLFPKAAALVFAFITIIFNIFLNA